MAVYADPDAKGWLHPNNLKRVTLALKTLGIVGGIGPESTVDYYRSLIRIWHSDRKWMSNFFLLSISLEER